MQSAPRWSILIVSVSERGQQLKAMLTELLEQIEPYEGDVTVLCYVDDFDHPRWAARQLLVDEATADYVNFVDDDDFLAGDYVERIHACLDGVVDYVGFRLQCFWDDEPLKPTTHSLRYAGWSEDAEGFYRGISHLNPMRRELAAKVRFPEVRFEDHDWAQELMALDIVKTEAFVDEVLYFYDFNTRRTLTNPGNRTFRPSRARLPRSPLIRYFGPDG